MKRSINILSSLSCFGIKVFSNPAIAMLFFVVVMFKLSLSCVNNPSTLSVAPKDTVFTMLYPFFSPEGDKIFFFGELFGVEGSGLYEVDTSGGVVRLIMWDSLAKSNPRLSPAGNKIAYQAASKGRLLCCSHVYVMNTNGSEVTDYTSWGGFWQGHRWSPDGTKLLLSGPVEKNGIINNQILVMNADGTDPRFITSGDSGSGQPRWSSEGKQIFYVTKHIYNELSTEVYMMNIDGSNKQPVDSSHQGSNLPRPSPTRKEILLAWKNQVPYESGGYLLEYDSTSFPAGEASFKYIVSGFINECEWSPDGNLIAQKRDLSAGIEDLYLFNRDGTNNRRLTYGLRVSWFSWSGDSKCIVLRSHATAEENFGFFIVNVEQGTCKKLLIIR